MEIKEFNFDRARRITPEEVEANRQRIKMLTGKLPPRRRRGRPAKAAVEKYQPIAMRIHPLALKWVKKEGKKRGVGYQTVINELLLKEAAGLKRARAA